MSDKEYIGDGVYAEITEWGDIIVTTEDGVKTTNRIVFELPVYRAFMKYVMRIHKERNEQNEM